VTHDEIIRPIDTLIHDWESGNLRDRDILDAFDEMAERAQRAADQVFDTMARASHYSADAEPRIGG
jgi:hypothetical protein